jgi:hypothetical protein
MPSRVKWPQTTVRCPWACGLRREAPGRCLCTGQGRFALAIAAEADGCRPVTGRIPVGRLGGCCSFRSRKRSLRGLLIDAGLGLGLEWIALRDSRHQEPPTPIQMKNLAVIAESKETILIGGNLYDLPRHNALSFGESWQNGISGWLYF